jgi:hypothetical protein
MHQECRDKSRILFLHTVIKRLCDGYRRAVVFTYNVREEGTMYHSFPPELWQIAGSSIEVKRDG